MWTFLLPSPANIFKTSGCWPYCCPVISNNLSWNSTHCLISIASYRSPAKKLRSINRLIKYIKKKWLEEVQPSHSIVTVPSTSITLSPPPMLKRTLSFSWPTLTDVPPEVPLTQEFSCHVRQPISHQACTLIYPSQVVVLQTSLLLFNVLTTIVNLKMKKNWWWIAPLWMRGLQLVLHNSTLMW